MEKTGGWKGKRKQTLRKNGKKDCNLLYNIKERKSGAKPEGIRKTKRLHCIIQKCIRKSLAFPAIRRLDEVKNLP